VKSKCSSHRNAFASSQSLSWAHSLNPTQRYDLNPQISQREVGESH
jgi:hypothetical protein